MGDSVAGDRQMSKLLHAEVCQNFALSRRWEYRNTFWPRFHFGATLHVIMCWIVISSYLAELPGYHGYYMVLWVSWTDPRLYIASIPLLQMTMICWVTGQSGQSMAWKNSLHSRHFWVDSDSTNWSRKPWAFSLPRRTHLWSFRVQRFRAFRTWIPLGMTGMTSSEGFFEYFFGAERQRPKQWSQTFQWNGGLSFFHVFNVFLSIFIERMYCLVVSQDSVLYSVLHSFRVTSFSWQFHSQVGQGHL